MCLDIDPSWLLVLSGLLASHCNLRSTPPTRGGGLLVSAIYFPISCRTTHGASRFKMGWGPRDGSTFLLPCVFRVLPSLLSCLSLLSWVPVGFVQLCFAITTATLNSGDSGQRFST